ncbi:hypothetical protein [Streptomyces sp. DSM 40750]|uniref:hypothetical protein n=1 Tax=Streptomyces sp. DSM 40750 TaxID=2801030 RepID=UPI00214BB311|nr:hypothetical protein [Streptomyces sp. DSM 40750]UUU24781.1 hypothetical protein JIX55_33525 [Streptomyces sp. DSM 40750]
MSELKLDGLDRSDRLDGVDGMDRSDGLGGLGGPDEPGASREPGGLSRPGASREPGELSRPGASHEPGGLSRPGERELSRGTGAETLTMSPPRATDSPGLPAPRGAMASPDPLAPGNVTAPPDPVAIPRPVDDALTAATPEPAPRRGAVDPVKALMHRHRELCERAVDPLEIAAGLEAHGVTDRTAARFRHRDVFSLAEEMYARVSREGEESTERGPVPSAPGARGGWAVLALLPGALCAAAVTGVRVTDGQPRLVTATFGALAVALGLRVALGRGPLRTPPGTTSRTRVWTCWLIAYALLGDGLLAAGLDGGPHGPWPLATAPVLALTLACAPATWCAHLLSVRARRKLAASRGLAEFADSMKPLILGVFALHLCALAALLSLCGAVLDESAGYAGAGALGALLLLARLLTAHGFTHAPAVALRTAALTEAIALATVFASRLPGCSSLAAAVETVVGARGPGAIPALVCGATALVLLVHVIRTLTRASAHALPSGET